MGLHTPLTISLGVSSCPEHSTWTKDLIEKADQALYHAKESGRNMSCLYQPNMSKSVKRIDKLAGIISGSQVEDQRRVETMLEILELQRSTELTVRDKLYNFLGRIIEVSEAQTGILFQIEEEGKISGRLIRKKLLDAEVGEAHYNEGLVYKCMESRQGEYQLDWSSYPGVDPVTGMPDWQSVMIVPLTNKGELKGILYLTVSMKNREYDAESYNYIKTLCDMMASIF
jgi:transcriptional regulator with GAF, ATPase, and Fis domain